MEEIKKNLINEMTPCAGSDRVSSHKVKCLFVRWESRWKMNQLNSKFFSTINQTVFSFLFVCVLSEKICQRVMFFFVLISFFEIKSKRSIQISCTGIGNQVGESI